MDPLFLRYSLGDFGAWYCHMATPCSRVAVGFSKLLALQVSVEYRDLFVRRPPIFTNYKDLTWPYTLAAADPQFSTSQIQGTEGSS